MRRERPEHQANVGSAGGVVLKFPFAVVCLRTDAAKGFKKVANANGVDLADADDSRAVIPASRCHGTTRRRL